MTVSLSISRLAICALMAAGATAAAAQTTPAANPADTAGAESAAGASTAQADAQADAQVSSGATSSPDAAGASGASSGTGDSADAAPVSGSVTPVTGAGAGGSAPAPSGSAEDASYRQVVDGSFEDVTFAVEQAITNAGLVIDSTHLVGDMLARTKADVGGAQDLYVGANVYSFCSAIESRKAMEQDIASIEFCPYGIFVYETVAEPGKITVGHNIYPGDAMMAVNKMLGALVDSAVQ